jgi:hypothetical protein
MALAEGVGWRQLPAPSVKSSEELYHEHSSSTQTVEGSCLINFCAHMHGLHLCTQHVTQTIYTTCVKMQFLTDFQLPSTYTRPVRCVNVP